MTHQLYASKVIQYQNRIQPGTGIVLSANEWRKYKSSGAILEDTPLDKILSFILLTYPGHLNHLINHFQSDLPLEQTIFRTSKSDGLSIYEIFFKIKKELEVDLQSIENQVRAITHANNEFYTTQKTAILKAKKEDLETSLDQLKKSIIEFSRQENKEHNELTYITNGDLREFVKAVRTQNSELAEEKDRWISNKRSVEFHTWAYSILRSFISAAGTCTLFAGVLAALVGWNPTSFVAILTVALITSVAFLTSVFSHWELARDNTRKHLKTEGFFAFISRQHPLQKLLTIAITVGVMSIYTFPFFQNVMKLSSLGGPYDMFMGIAAVGTVLIAYEVFLIFSKQVADFCEKLNWKNVKAFFDEELTQPFNAGKYKIVFANLFRMSLTISCIVIGNMVTFGGLTSAISFTTNLLMPFLSTTAKASIAWTAKILVGVLNSIGSFIFSGKKLYNALGNVIAPKDEKIEEFNRAANFQHSKEIPTDNPDKKIPIHSDPILVQAWRIVDGIIRSVAAFFSNIAFKALEFADGFDAHTLQNPNPVAHPILGPSCSAVISAFNKISGTVPPDLHRGAIPPKSTYGELKELKRPHNQSTEPADDEIISETPSSESPNSVNQIGEINESFQLPRLGNLTPTNEHSQVRESENSTLPPDENVPLLNLRNRTSTL